MIMGPPHGLLPNRQGAIRPGQKIGHKTHDDVESDICHTEALNQRLLGGVKDCLPEIKRPQKSPMTSPIR